MDERLHSDNPLLLSLLGSAFESSLSIGETSPQ